MNSENESALQREKFIKMTEYPVERLICRLAVPTVISMMITSIYNMSDTYFVGKLENVSATGAVGVVFPLMTIIQAVGFFFGHGSGNYMSRSLGSTISTHPKEWLPWDSFPPCCVALCLPVSECSL